MKVLIIEYFTSGLFYELPLDFINPSHNKTLWDEGMLMLNTLAKDLHDIESVKCVTLFHQQSVPKVPYIQFGEIVVAKDKIMPILADYLDEVDAFWPIAPETDGILEKMCRLCEHKGKLLLNSGSAAVNIGASKSKTIATLEAYGICCAPTILNKTSLPTALQEEDFSVLRDLGEMIVVKPDKGVGCTDTYIMPFTDFKINDYPDYVVQTYLQGQDASLSVAYGINKYYLLAANCQQIQRVGKKMFLQSCAVNRLQRKGLMLDKLAQDIGTAMPELRGYVGIDFIVKHERTYVLEVNPRLTTSYVGMRQSTGINPAELIINMLR